jgi:stalled ribosome rescue protein Dom34
MSTNKKQFGVWMDSQSATIVGRENVNSGDFVVIGHAKNSGASGNSNENAANNQEQGLTTKFFKEITTSMQNIDEIEVTGTGQVQEQFIKHLADTPQYKNVVATESTSNKMSDEKLVEYITAKFN